MIHQMICKQFAVVERVGWKLGQSAKEQLILNDSYKLETAAESRSHSNFERMNDKTTKDL